MTGRPAQVAAVVLIVLAMIGCVALALVAWRAFLQLMGC